MEEMNNIYEAEVNEVNDLVPIEAEEEAGMSTGLAMTIGAVGGILGILIIKLGEKVIDGGKKFIAKCKAKKAEEAATKEAEQAAEKPAEEAVPEEA